MKRKMKVIVSMALAASMTLVNSFTAITTFAQTSTVQSTSELIAKEAGALRMGLFGDSHILRWNNGDGNYSANAMVKAVNKVLQTFNTQQVDGLALTGDNVYQLDSSYGNSDKDDLSYVPYNYLKKSLNENGGWWTYPEGETFDITQDVNHGGKLSDNVVYTMGNHEFPQNDNTAEGAQATREIFETAMGIKPEDDRKIGGYHFITAAGNDYNSNMTTEVQKGVIEKIDAAHEEDATKPVFVLIHHPIHETICGSNSAANSKYNSDDESFDFKTELNKRPYVIVFCAHTHYAAQNLRSIWQDGFTVVHTPLVSGSNMSAESSDLSMLGQTSIQVSQGMMMDVKDGVVTIYRLDFDNGEFIGEPYVIDINKGVDGFKYKNRTPGTPYFENGASITVNEIESTSVTISFPAAVAPVENGENEGYVSKYKVTATDSAGATITKTFLSDFWKSPSKRASSFTATLSGLEVKTAYTLTVTPITTLGGTGTPLSVDITSAGILANLPDSMSFTSADMLDTSTATVNDDGTITIAQNQTARFARTIGSNAQYTVKISSDSAMNSAAVTLNVTRKGNTDTDNTDVAKIWKKSVAADATSATLGYIGFIQGYNEIGITNTSANDITISAVDLSKKTYTGEEKLIEIPMFNYNPGGKNVGYYTWITSQASNYRQYGEYMSVYNDVAKAVIRDGEWFKYDVELNQAQEYYVVVNDGVEKNANARYVLEINDEYKLDKTVPQTATTSNYIDTYRLLGKIKLNKGVNTIKLSAKQTQEYYGMLLIKADTVINLTPDSMNINANSAQILKRAGYSFGSGVNKDGTGYSLPNSTRLGYIVYVQSPGTYKLDYTGANKTTNEKFYTYFDNAVMKTTALASDSPNYSTIKVLGTAEDIFLSSGIHFIELNRSGNLQTGTTYSGTWGQYVFRQMQFAKTADYTPEGAYEFKVKATDFNRYAGESTGFKSVGTYDNSNNIYDEWYKPIRATSTGIVGIYNGEWLAYDIYAPKAGYYTVTASAGVDTGNMQFTVSTENSSITSPLCAATGSWSTYSNFDLGQIYLEEGYNLVKVANTGTTCNLQSVSFTVPTMAFYDTAGEKITSFVNSSELTGKAETGDIVNAVLLMADYDESGRLISVNNVSKAEAESLQTKITTDSQSKEVKLFIFDNIQNIIPLAGYESIELGQ